MKSLKLPVLLVIDQRSGIILEEINRVNIEIFGVVSNFLTDFETMLSPLGSDGSESICAAEHIASPIKIRPEKCGSGFRGHKLNLVSVINHHPVCCNE